MRRTIDRRAAAVEAESLAVGRLENTGLASESIVEA